MAYGLAPSDDKATPPHVLWNQSAPFGREHHFDNLQRIIPVDLNPIRQHRHTHLLLPEHTHQVEPCRTAIHAFRALEILGQHFRSAARVALLHGFDS